MSIVAQPLRTGYSRKIDMAPKVAPRVARELAGYVKHGETKAIALTADEEARLDTRIRTRRHYFTWERSSIPVLPQARHYYDAATGHMFTGYAVK